MSKYNLPKNCKIYAELTYWNGDKETVEIKEEYIDDIVSAVKGQYTFIDNKNHFAVCGGSIYHVDITYKNT